MISYSQNFEDVLLERLFRDKARGFYIDVGAADPIENSVTKHFYDKGWHGINAEPLGRFYRKLCLQRPRDINLNIGLAESDQTTTFFESEALPEWSTFRPDLGLEHQKRGLLHSTRTVHMRSLASLCREHNVAEIDFLKIDVEGYEDQVLAGADWDQWRPRVLIVEAAGYEAWEYRLVSARYHYAIFDGVNRFYVREEDQHLIELLQVPVNCLDGFELYRYQQRINELEARLLAVEELGPVLLGLATSVKRLSRSFPRVSAALKKSFRLGK